MKESPNSTNRSIAGVRKQRHKRLRRVVSLACLVAAALAVLPITAQGWPSLAVLSLSPLVAAASALGARTFQATMLIGLLVALAAVVRRRWFCRWVCPTGRCANGASRIGLRLGRRCPRVPSLGPWIAWISLAGALVGYPALLWLDPLAIFSGSFSVFRSSGPAAMASAVALPAVLILSLLLPGAWCGKICPLGALQDFFYHAVRAVWPSHAPSGNALLRERRRLLRNVVLGSVMGAVWAATAKAMRVAMPRALRPPGARDETTFLGLCVRCGNCIRVCPSRIIEQDLADHGVAGLLAPVLRFHEDYCRENCVRCTEVCPSGALARQSLDAKPRQTRIGLPRVDMNLCLLSNDRECAVCRNSCPYEAISLVFSESEYTLVPVVDAQKCPGCGACEAACPTQPVKAIQVLPH
ncbi:MAG: 4Fe-4S dicluster domain-containing protein [Thermoguttaceae bacterium]